MASNLPVAKPTLIPALLLLLSCFHLEDPFQSPLSAFKYPCWSI